MHRKISTNVGVRVFVFSSEVWGFIMVFTTEHTYVKSNKTILKISGFLQNGGVLGV